MSECDNCKNKKNFPCPNSCGYMGVCDGYEPKPITNADRIRAMSDEELAKLWWEHVDCGECPVHKDCRMTGQACKTLALDWLRQETTDA